MLVSCRDYGQLIDKIAGYDIVFLDGARGTGKTTLAKRLIEDHGFDYFRALNSFSKRARTNVGGLKLMDAPFFITEFVSQIGVKHKVVVDRSVLATCVYQGYNHERMIFFAGCMNNSVTNICHVVLHCSPETCLDRLNKRVEETFKFGGISPTIDQLKDEILQFDMMAEIISVFDHTDVFLYNSEK